MRQDYTNADNTYSENLNAYDHEMKEESRNKEQATS